jgi:hypothetical protein
MGSMADVMLRLVVLTTIGLAVLRLPDQPSTTSCWCVLALPPSQVAPVPRLELVYHHPPIGWIAVTDPFACD